MIESEEKRETKRERQIEEGEGRMKDNNIKSEDKGAYIGI